MSNEEIIYNDCMQENPDIFCSECDLKKECDLYNDGE